ncbi:receptor-like protein 12 [Capsella rubella]|uniref:receptor-like protein 12 n=1 Tax=Capsella rubella TaxID=81985 RepID=UPI000CD526B5|nr:receptor-like protein 12 [Capsella rubella]
MHCFGERKMIIWSLCLILILVFGSSHAKHLCHPDQREALWEFKSEFYVQKPDEMKSNTTTEMWRHNTDCCSWDGISCNPKTGKVVELALGDSYLNGPLRSNSSLFRLQHLRGLYLSYNNISSVLPDSIGKLKYLRVLSLGDCNFFGKIPSSIGNLSHLTSLDLSSNGFTGELPDSMGSLNRLTNLELVSNKLGGKFPHALLNLSEITMLDLRDNQFEGIGLVSFNIFLNLKSLTFLDISYLNTRSIVDIGIFSGLMSLSHLDLSGINSKISSTLHLPSSMFTLILSSCNISEFPKFIQNQTSLRYLDISANQIEGQVPEWLWGLPGLRYVNISQNLFNDLPLLPNSTMFFSGSDNQFSGEIPRAICKLVALDTLVLSNNNLNGSIPRCFKNFRTTLSVLHLRNNSLSGIFPDESIGDKLRSLDVGHNRLSGELPMSLINCTELEFLNVEDNIINDKFPSWLSLLPNLQILVLRSNEFYGPISSLGDSLSFPKLRIFDISDNRFTGVLPSDYFSGWTAISYVVDIEDRTPLRYAGRGSGYYHKSVGMTNKGSKMELVGSGFTIYKTIDVSRNRFEGNIPESISVLKELIVLNMSNNAFTGHIPTSLSNLTNLQSLDLSQNRLTGEIPPDLGKLTFLAWMNFSYNKLEGPIPHGTQFQSQNSSSFVENTALCGLPLKIRCGGEETTKQEQDEEKEEEEEQVFSWIAAAIGYVPGVVCGLTIAHILTSYKRDWFMNTVHYFT